MNEFSDSKHDIIQTLMVQLCNVFIWPFFYPKGFVLVRGSWPKNISKEEEALL